MNIDSGSMQLSDFVDLERYPIDHLDSDRGQALLAQCHEMMAADTLVALPGFLRPEANDRLVNEISTLESQARNIDFLSTAYGWMDNSDFHGTHPRSQLLRRRCGAITAEQFESDGLCIRLFQFDQLTEFVRRLLGYRTLYRSCCPTVSVRLNIMRTGDEFGWHFDTNDGVVSFITQNADSGGKFEYAPLIRSEEDENYSGVGRIMSEIDSPRCASTPPGTFVLFLGRRSLHRVSKVVDSANTRQSLLFSYDKKPGMVFPAAVRKRLTQPTSDAFLGTGRAT